MMNITDLVGGGWKKLMDDKIQEKGIDVDYFEPLVFNTMEEAEDFFFKKHDCTSDDADEQQARVDAWIQGNGVVISELE